MDSNQKSLADHIIKHLLAIDVDGETMEHILNGTHLKQQLLRQLILQSSDFELNPLLEERGNIHDSMRIYAVSGGKYRFKWAVWLPLLGLLSMLYFTEFGRYRTIYFAGLIWQPYQMLCFMGTVLLCATYCH